MLFQFKPIFLFKNYSNCNSNLPPVNGIHICHLYPADTVYSPASYLTHTVAAALSPSLPHTLHTQLPLHCLHPYLLPYTPVASALSPPLPLTLHTQLPLHCLHPYLLPYTHSCLCIVSTPTSSL